MEYHCENGIAQVTINRPEVLNALNGTVFTELKQMFEELKTRDEVRVIILTGKGDRAFAA
ncbi:MAG: crotonase, partial [Syntrophomonadaceae bacterium]|nr:crotonase [Syntrophomonadaceae bacterium]